MLSLQLLLLTAAGLSQATETSHGHYLEQGECQSDKVCLYNYVVDQQFFDGDAKQNITISANVEISCHSVGQFNGTPATQYCMRVSQAELQGSVFNETSDADLRYQQRSIDQLLSGWFCFVQVRDGKIVAVHHAVDENEDAVDLKKSIATAFQANFKGTEHEEEEDAQSDHIAHYRYEQNTDHVKKMHRVVGSDDVIDYSTGANKRDIQLKKDEDIEYQDGILYHSSGDTLIKIKNKKHVLEPPDEHQNSFSDAFSAHGSFTLDLKQCYTQPKKDKTRQRRSLKDRMNENMKEEGLKINFNITLTAQRRLMVIRDRIPSVTMALIKLHQNPENTKLTDQLGLLLELEYKYGTPATFRPAIRDVLDYLESIWYSQKLADRKMRDIILTLLSTQGSLRSQLTLLEALQDAATPQEVDSITVQIATVSNAHVQFVRSLEQLLAKSVWGSEEESFGLLLSFGALASDAQPEVEYEVTSFLLGLQEMLTSMNTTNTAGLVHLILAMGNTGSVNVVSDILSYINTDVKEIQQASIRALLKFSHLEVVRSSLADVLDMHPDEETVILITHTIVKGHGYLEDHNIEISPENNDLLTQSLVSAVLRFNNTDLTMLVARYLEEQGSSMVDALQSRLKRGTSDWDSSSSSEYNLVASLSSRRSDVTNYPKHTAYLYGKTFGIDKANLKAAAGVFLGLSNDCENLKGYGKVYAEANVLSKQRTLADIQILLQKTGTSIRGKIYVEIAGNTLVNQELSGCRTYNTPLTRSRYRVYRFTYSIFVYVGTVDISVSLYLGMSVNFDAQPCGSYGTVGIVPQVSFSVEGSASFTLLFTVRAGITASVTIVYQVEPRASARVCAVNCQGAFQTCAGIYDSWPGNYIELYAWYQTRRIRWCGSWFRYPCGLSWRSRRRWSAFDFRWSIGSSSRRALYERCYPTNSPTCSASPAAI